MNAEYYDILLVEDDLGDAGLARRAFKDGAGDCRLHHARDGLEALQFLRRQTAPFAAAPRPQLILLDLNMPRMDGHGFLREMKNDPALCDIPVVVLTTSESDVDIRQSYAAGAASYIAKPLDIFEFIESVRVLRMYWFGVVRLPR